MKKKKRRTKKKNHQSNDVAQWLSSITFKQCKHKSKHVECHTIFPRMTKYAIVISTCVQVAHVSYTSHIIALHTLVHKENKEKMNTPKLHRYQCIFRTPPSLFLTHTHALFFRLLPSILTILYCSFFCFYTN